MKNFYRALTLVLAVIITLSIGTIPAMAAAPDAINGFGELDIPDYIIPEEDELTIDKVPLYNQKHYPDIPYGKYGSISTHGCGLVSVWMVATYLNDEIYDIADLAEQFGSYNTKGGSEWILIADSAEALGLKLVDMPAPGEACYNWKKVKEALHNGQVVIALYGPDSYFTSGGHFVVLTGVNENGLYTVNDPYGGNYQGGPVLQNGFANGFTESQIKAGSVTFWIYESKETHIAMRNSDNEDAAVATDDLIG